MDSGIQLEMNFESNRNRLHDKLNSGEFFVLFEVNTPSAQADLKSSQDRLSEIEFATAAIKGLPAALAITDKYNNHNSWNIADFASVLAPAERDRHLLYLSGRNTTWEEMQHTLQLCHSAGLRNVTPVSGSGIIGETARQTAARTFVESVHSIRHIKAQYRNEFYTGCVVNPFKYTPGDLFSQYFKLVKKLHQGAEFFVTQFGWDMLKLQELRWYLDNRGLHIPAIARILMLTPEKYESIIAGKYPGVHLSPDFRIILQNELKYSYTQFEAAQWRRIQLQAAGARLLGYNGIQLAGLERPDKIMTAATRIREALEEFTHFEDWRKAYYEHLARAEMAPYPHRFYLFDRLFSQAHADNCPHMNDAELPRSSAWENFYYNICQFMFSHAAKQSADEHFISKKLLSGCPRCKNCRLPQTYYICPETCPKAMANGPCGGSKADGKCELSNTECIHSRKLRLALRRNEADLLEERYIKPGF